MVILGPRPDLHTGAHHSLASAPPAGVSYEIRDANHFLALDGENASPYESFSSFEGCDFGPGEEVVHSSRWPVINRRRWVADTDDFGFPVLCGRFMFSVAFRRQFGEGWQNDLRAPMVTRAHAMLSAYLHPSCKALFFRSNASLQSARNWLQHPQLKEIGKALLDKAHVLYPAAPVINEVAMRNKWSTKKELRIVFCGRDFPTKNGVTALRIFATLPSEVQTRITYLGEIPEKTREDFGALFDRMKYVPNADRSEVLGILQDSHVLFHTARFEGVGIVLLEAAAAGMAVICGQGGGMPDLHDIFGDDGALFVSLNDDHPAQEMAEFAASLDAMVRNPALASNLAFENRRRCATGHLSIAARDRILLGAYQSNTSSNALTTTDVEKLVDKRLTTLTSDAIERYTIQHLDSMGVSTLRVNL
jgi:glycosyltransferase involved in cell wall biosynthesis